MKLFWFGLFMLLLNLGIGLWCLYTGQRVGWLNLGVATVVASQLVGFFRH